MKISFLIPAIVLYVVSVAYSTPIRVGTVLFTTTDLVKKCWTENDKCLLKARLVMQDVLPDPECIDFSNQNAVAILLDYFHSCFQIISIASYGRIQNLMYLALADALGGYLRAYVLPFTRMAYYAGTVKYTDAKKLFQLYDDIRVFLKTNGGGWSEPHRVSFPKFKVRPLVITGGALEACNELYLIEKEGRLHSINIHDRKKNPEEQKKGGNETENLLNTLDFQRRRFRKYRSACDTCQHCVLCNATVTNMTEPLMKLLWKAMETASANSCDRDKEDTGVNTKTDEGTKQGKKDKSKDRLKGSKKNGAKSKSKDSSDDNTKDNSVDHMREGARITSKSGSGTKTNKEDDTKFSSKYNRKEEEEDEDSDDSKNDTDSKFDSKNEYKNITRRVIIPLPVLDDCEHPRSLAIPFKTRPFRSLMTGDSAFILEYYYITVMKCFIAKGNSRSDLKNFNSQFYQWLITQVTPHLCEEEWYPAFGGVLRVIQTIKKFGVDGSAKDSEFHSSAFLFSEGSEFTDMDNDTKSQENARILDEEAESNMSSRHTMLVMAVASIFWLLVFCTVVFYMQARGQKRSSKPPAKAVSYTDDDQPKPKSKTLNLEFLIKFFKGKDSNEQGSKSQTGQSQPQYTEGCRCWEYSRMQTQKDCEQTRTPCPAQQKCCQKTKVSAYPVETYKFTFDKAFKQKKLWSSGEELKLRNQGQGDQLQTLWKKPSDVEEFKGREETQRRVHMDSTIDSTASVGKTGVDTSYICSRCHEGKSREQTAGKRSTSTYSRESVQSQTSTASSTVTEEELLSSTTKENIREVTEKRTSKESSEQGSSECESSSSTADEY